MAVVNGSGRLCKDGKKLIDRDDKINGGGRVSIRHAMRPDRHRPGRNAFGQRRFARAMQPKPLANVLKKWPRINDTFTPFV
jgi:hypothetical protein